MEERFSYAERISHICSWEIDPSFTVWLYSSPNTENILGMPLDNIIGHLSIYLSSVHPDDRERVGKVYENAPLSKQPYEIEYRFQRHDGRTIFLFEYGEPIWDSEGEILGFRGTTQDITLLREAQNQAQQNLDRFNFAEKIASLSHWETDVDFQDQVYVSDNTEILFGIPRERMVGNFSTFSNTLHPQDREHVDATYLSTRQNPRPYIVEYRCIHSDGKVVYIRESGSPIWDGNGKIKGYRGTCQDITDLKQATRELEKSNAFARTIVETAVDGIITINSTGIVTSLNSATVKMFGYAAEDVIGNNIKMLMPESQSKQHDGYLKNYLETGTAQIIGIGREVVGKRKNGEEFPMNLSISEMLFDDNISFTGIVRDITERKAYETNLNRALTKAEESSRAKSEFLSTISHELRTPLNAIIGFSSIIGLEMFGPIGHKKYREYVADINSSGSHLLELINEILDVSAIESGKLQLFEENIDLYKATEAALRFVRDRAREGDIKLTNKVAKDMPALYADERRIKQILLNLLSNAVKFTPEGGEVSVVGMIEDQEMVLKIRDTGIGMDEEGLATAMKMFGQVDRGQESKHEGTGLGLPLTSGLIELHGGVLEIQSTPGKGTLASARFPSVRVIKGG